MTLDINFKEIIMIAGYIFTIISIFFMIKYRLKKVEDFNHTIKKVMFQEKGGLNVVSNSICHERRVPIHEIIERVAGRTDMLTDKVDNLSDNIHLVLGAMNVKPIKFVEKKNKTLFQCYRQGENKWPDQ